MNGRYLLDTNAASYAINKKSAAVDRHLARVAMAELGISAVTEEELCFGAARSGSAGLQATVEQFLLGVSIFAWDSEAAKDDRGARDGAGFDFGYGGPGVWADQAFADGGLDEIGEWGEKETNTPAVCDKLDWVISSR